MVVLCHKPEQLDEVAEQVGRPRQGDRLDPRGHGHRRARGAPTRTPPVYRFIPNIPAEVRQGVLCYVPGTPAAEGPSGELLELFGRAGAIIPLDSEPLIEPAMALMSCGPAFMALVAESFADAGARARPRRRRGAAA